MNTIRTLKHPCTHQQTLDIIAWTDNTNIICNQCDTGQNLPATWHTNITPHILDLRSATIALALR